MITYTVQVYGKTIGTLTHGGNVQQVHTAILALPEVAARLEGNPPRVLLALARNGSAVANVIP